jgi:hypothetical protein
LSFFKNPNGDELYSVTAVYKSSDYTGELIPDMEESKNLRFCRVDELPERMDQEYRDCIGVYLRVAAH